MRPIRELLEKRQAPLWSLAPEVSVFSALKRLADYNVGAMVVLENGRLLGIFSERDYTRKIALMGRSSKETRVCDIMSAKVLSVSAQTGVRECMALMGQNQIRHLPVMDGQTVLGLISMRDIMNDIIAEHEQTIDQLQAYICT